MLKAVLYLRVSSEDQAKKYSLSSQKKELTALAKKRSYKVVEIYDEGGISGESLVTRPQMLQLLEDAEIGNFSYLLITALDRISRDMKDSLYIRSKLQDAGVTIITPSQEFSHDSIDHDFTANLFGSMADYERKLILERCQQGRIEKRAKGGWLGGTPPIGYIYHPAQKKVVISENKAKEVQRILEASVSNSPYYASKQLYEQGIKISPRQIRRMVEKRKILFYNGKTIDYSGNIIKAEWPAIIKGDLVTKLLEAKQGRRTVGPRSTRAKYFLTGLGIFKCRSCGRTVKSFSSGSKATKAKYNYYKCSSIQYGEDCANRKMHRIPIIDDVIWRYTCKILIKIVDIESAYKERISKRLNSKTLIRLDKRLNTVQEKRNRLFNAVESGAIPVDEISDRFQKLKAEIAEIQLQKDSFKSDVEIPDFQALKTIAQNFNFSTDFNHEEKREVITLLFNRIELSRRSIYIQLFANISSSDVRIKIT